MVPAGAREAAGLHPLACGLSGPGRRRADSVIRSLRAFGAASGLPSSAACLLDYDVIEAFCVAALPGRAASARGTYRSVLYALAGEIHGPPSCRATPFAGAKAPPPYSRDERAGLISAARAQRTPAKRASAMAMVCFGLGAGLRPGELAALRGSRVVRAGARVVVRVAGPVPRTVPAAGRYGPVLEELARGAGNGFRPNSDSRDQAVIQHSRDPGRLSPDTEHQRSLGDAGVGGMAGAELPCACRAERPAGPHDLRRIPAGDGTTGGLARRQLSRWLDVSCRGPRQRCRGEARGVSATRTAAPTARPDRRCHRRGTQAGCRCVRRARRNSGRRSR
jgi:integrase